MQFALLYEDTNVFVSFNKDDSVKLLEQYYKQYKDVRKALEAIEVDLKNKTRYK